MGTIGKLLPILLAGAMMGGGLPQLSLPEPRERRIKLNSYRHTGEIPQGCKLETRILTVSHSSHDFSIKVDVVYGSEKGKHKKLKKYEQEIKEYLKNFSLEELIERNEFQISLPYTPL